MGAGAGRCHGSPRGRGTGRERRSDWVSGLSLILPAHSLGFRSTLAVRSRLSPDPRSDWVSLPSLKPRTRIKTRGRRGLRLPGNQVRREHNEGAWPGRDEGRGFSQPMEAGGVGPGAGSKVRPDPRWRQRRGGERAPGARPPPSPPMGPPGTIPELLMGSLIPKSSQDPHRGPPGRAWSARDPPNLRAWAAAQPHPSPPHTPDPSPPYLSGSSPPKTPRDPPGSAL